MTKRKRREIISGIVLEEGNARDGDFAALEENG
jgi:hypothetical protein